MTLPSVLTIDLASVDDRTWKESTDKTPRYTYGLSHGQIRSRVNAFAKAHNLIRADIITERFSILPKALFWIAIVALAGGIGSFLVGVIVEIFGSDEYFMVMGINLVVFVALPVWFLAKVFAHPTAEEVLKHDMRAPIVYLRSFADEGQTLSATSKLESTISDYFTYVRFIGRLIAIGDAGVGAKIMLGASRAVIPDENWKNSISSWIDKARMIIVVPFGTKGLQWELQRVIAKGHLNKLLILFPPASSTGRGVDWDTMEEKRHRLQALDTNLTSTSIPARLQSVNFEHVLAIHFRAGNAPVILRGEPYAHINSSDWSRLYEEVLDVAFYGMFCVDWDRQVRMVEPN